jgi:hypothetical protein
VAPIAGAVGADPLGDFKGDVRELHTLNFLSTLILYTMPHRIQWQLWENFIPYMTSRGPAG